MSFEEKGLPGEIIPISSMWLQRDRNGHAKIIIRIQGSSEELVLSEVTGSHGYMSRIAAKKSDFHFKGIDNPEEVKR